MSADVYFDPDSRFLVDNLLTKDDWDFEGLDKCTLGTGMDLDLEAANFGLDPAFDPDELIKSMGGELALPLVGGTILSSKDLPMDFQEDDTGDSNSDSGISAISVKLEPLSPASSHCSDNSNDSAYSQQPYMESLLNPDMILGNYVPLTPPGDTSDATLTTNTSVAKITRPAHSILNKPGCTKAIYNMNSELACVIKEEPKPLSPNVINVMNSKIKIQPKPEPHGPISNGVQSNSPIPAPVTKSGPTNPLVLTPDEFAKLTAQGILKFQAPGQKPSATSADVSGVNSVSNANESTDFRLVKRQQRMIKNRESACLSRKRKKEYMSSLEERLKSCYDDNKRLSDENLNLKRKIQTLENENVILKKGVGLGISRKTTAATCVLSVLFLLSLNIVPYSLLNSRSRTSDGLKVIGIPSHDIHHGRSLLSVKEDHLYPLDAMDSEFSQKPWKLAKALHSIKERFKSLDELSSNRDLSDTQVSLLLQHLKAFTACPSYFNKTESQRLANELTGWVLGHKQQNKKQQKRKRKSKTYEPIRKKKLPPRGSLRLRPSYGDNKYQVQVFQGPDQSYFDFLNSINRRNDTFYVVSFRRDHLLLPALAHNKTMRPRMSLMMPAVSLNESMQPPTGHVAMMQIDCEVMDTNLVHLKNSNIPSFAREQNDTGSQFGRKKGVVRRMQQLP